jgi:hypothetical protein
MMNGALAVLLVVGIAVGVASMINPSLFAFIASLLERWQRSREPPAFDYHGLAREEVTALSIDEIDLLDQLIRTELFANGRAALVFLQLADRLQVHDVLSRAAEIRDQQRRVSSGQRHLRLLAEDNRPGGRRPESQEENPEMSNRTRPCGAITHRRPLGGEWNEMKPGKDRSSIERNNRPPRQERPPPRAPRARIP